MDTTLKINMQHSRNGVDYSFTAVVHNYTHYNNILVIALYHFIILCKFCNLFVDIKIATIILALIVL